MNIYQKPWKKKEKYVAVFFKVKYITTLYNGKYIADV